MSGELVQALLDLAFQIPHRAEAEGFGEIGPHDDREHARQPLLETAVRVFEQELGARLQPGQTVMLSTDAYPGEEFRGVIDRISPVFRQDTRQARVELTIANQGLRLKPGMFIRSTVELARLAEATIVAEQAITSRDDRTGIFVVNEGKNTVSWRPVRVGIREEGRVQIEGEGLSGRAVSLGHQLIEDGSPVIMPEGGKSPAKQGADN